MRASDKKLALFNRANNLRFKNEFDKAAGIYESIITEIEASQSRHITLYADEEESNFAYWLKVIGGGLLWFIVAIAGLFSKDKNRKFTIK